MPEYAEMNARLNWHMSASVDVSIAGFNLLHGRHLEYDNGGQDLIPRSVMGETRWRF